MGLGESLLAIMPIIFLLILVGLVITIQILLINAKYKKSRYFAASGNTFFKTIMDKGNYGEFLTFCMLERLQGYYMLLTNIYLHKKDGNTTEIDLMMLHTTGIYVFESKNYSGWIFGDEKNKMWTQSLKGGKKYKFYNPVIQNKGHISALINHIGKQYIDKTCSYIVFSERCELKKITITSNNIAVVNRQKLIKSLSDTMRNKQAVLSPQEINQLYNQLSQYTHADERAKQKHIQDIKAVINK